MKQAVFFTFLFLICSMAYGADIEESPAKRDLKLELVVELTRHGERASKADHPHLVSNKSFEVAPKELTKVGAESHHAIGKNLRKEFTETGLINTKHYNPSEIYV